jgi:hypothetical protein
MSQGLATLGHFFLPFNCFVGDQHPFHKSESPKIFRDVFCTPRWLNVTGCYPRCRLTTLSRVIQMTIRNSPHRPGGNHAEGEATGKTRRAWSRK